MRIILIPGLGYNCRIFENLKLSDFNTQCLNWIEPRPNEKLNEYSQRIFNQIDNYDDELVIIGHSLGGIVAQEIASVKKVDQIILISSIKSRQEMPWSFKIVKPLFLHKLFTKEMSINTLSFWGKNHGFETQNEKNLFNDMVSEQSNFYLQWALKSLSLWREPKIPNSTKIFQIHGTNDKTFPIKLIDKPNVVVKNGSHIFIHKQAKKATELITERIKNVV